MISYTYLYCDATSNMMYFTLESSVLCVTPDCSEDIKIPAWDTLCFEMTASSRPINNENRDVSADLDLSPCLNSQP